MKGLHAYLGVIGRIICSLHEGIFEYSCFIRGRFIPVSSFRTLSIQLNAWLVIVAYQREVWHAKKAKY